MAWSVCPAMSSCRYVARRRYGSRMARRRDARRYGPGPYMLGLRRNSERWSRGFPYDVPVIDAVDELDLSTPVTLLSGRQRERQVDAHRGDRRGDRVRKRRRRAGAVGRAARRPAIGPWRRAGAATARAHEAPQRLLPARGELLQHRAVHRQRPTSSRPTCRCTATCRCTSSPTAQSFLALAANRFGGEGLYILDEPEAALSVTGSARAARRSCSRGARAGAQFVIATHSPILLACPDARIYELDDTGFAECGYDELDAVRLTRGFLAEPDRYVRAALAAMEPE